MWFLSVNETIELGSDIPATQILEESSWVWGSLLVEGLSGSLTCLRVPQGALVPQVEDHWSLGTNIVILKNRQILVGLYLYAFTQEYTLNIWKDFDIHQFGK
jgi:hypothetical protein